MSRFPRFLNFCLLAVLGGLSLAMALPALAKDSKSAPAKTVGFSGDPAKKRGLEIGYDKGSKAGKKDKDANLKPDPSRHEIYKDPKKEYRYEYGSAASFTAGFRSGFLGGYKQAFGGSVKISAGSTGVTGSSGLSPTSTPKTPTTPKVKKSTAASDAL